MADIGYLAELAKEIGFLLQFSILYKPLKRQFEMAMDEPETKTALKEIKEYKKKGYPIFTSLENLDFALRWPFPYSKGCATKEELPQDLFPAPMASNSSLWRLTVISILVFVSLESLRP